MYTLRLIGVFDETDPIRTMDPPGSHFKWALASGLMVELNSRLPSCIACRGLAVSSEVLSSGVSFIISSGGASSVKYTFIEENVVPDKT